MKLPNNPHLMMEVEPRSSRGFIAVGLPVDSGVFFQEFWLKGTPHYAIANSSQEMATVALAEWNGKVGPRLTEPWVISPNTVRCYNIQPVQVSYSGPLLAVSLNENPVWGLLKSPQPSPDTTDQKDFEVVTTYGLNGIGDRHANIRCLQEQLVFESAQVAPVLLQLPRPGGIVSFIPFPGLRRLPQAIVVRAASDTLCIKREVGSYVIEARETQSAGYDEVRLEVKLPEVEAQTMAPLWGHISYSSGAGFSFGRGLIVHASH